MIESTQSAPTPFMAQYLRIKSENPNSLLFFRMGDFYELFFDDAVQAAEALDITLTHRGQHKGDPIPMAGVPHHSAEPYLSRLIRLGFRVAICEQTETPAEAKKRGYKSVVNREIVRVVTPGTLTEDTLLDARNDNYLCAISVNSDQSTFGLALADISTGDFRIISATKLTLSSVIAGFDPSEIVVMQDDLTDGDFLTDLRQFNIPIAPHTTRQANTKGGKAFLASVFGLNSADGLGSFQDLELAAIGLLLSYIELTQAGDTPELDFPRHETLSSYMTIDETTRHALEIERTQSGARKGSLRAAIDLTQTAAGSRRLSDYLARPLMSVDDISARQDAIQVFLEHDDIREDIQKQLKGVPDIERVRSRLRLHRASPGDVVSIIKGIEQAEIIAPLLKVLPLETSSKLHAISDILIDLSDQTLSPLKVYLTAMMVEDPPAQLHDGGVIRAGADDALDHYRTLRDDSKKIISGLESEYQALADLPQLKIKFNNMLGYFVEVPARFVDDFETLDSSSAFHRRQGLANANRYSTEKLANLAREIDNATTEARLLETKLFHGLIERILLCSDALRHLSSSLAELDVFAGNAEWAAAFEACRPSLSNSRDLLIEGGRHPVVEAAMRKEGKGFVSNDLTLTGDSSDTPRLQIITGPNMAGKSTYLRQTALLVILAQSGLYVPARSMTLGIVDRVFTRVGASDDLAKGKSTFMVEMLETASILNQASENALVILDEVGRGTSTYDGMAIAWACVEYLHDIIRCRGLFATHYHELTKLAVQLPFAGNLSLKAREWRGDLIFLHEIQDGPADKSYGVQVARLAGLPKNAVNRAKKVLEELEKSQNQAHITDDMPLFGFQDAETAKTLQDVVPVTEQTALIELVEKTDPDNLSPREALEVLYQLKKLL